MVAPCALDLVRLRERLAWKRYTNIARLASYIGVLLAPFSLWALFWTSPKDYPFLSSMLFVHWRRLAALCFSVVPGKKTDLLNYCLALESG